VSEKITQPAPVESIEKLNKKEFIALARELCASQEIFPFPGIKPESLAKLRAADEEYPGYTTPTDEIVERLKNEGMKVMLGKYPESGNVFILPAGSDDIEKDMIFPKHFQTNGVLNEKLRNLIEH